MILRNHVALIVIIDVASAFATFSNHARVTLLGAFRAMNRPLFTRARARLTAGNGDCLSPPDSRASFDTYP